MTRIVACLLALFFWMSSPAMERNACFWHSSLAAENTVPLWRAVKPGELADIQAQNAFRNLGQAEGKYFSTTAEGAASYAKQAFYGFKDPPYTLIKTEVPSSFINRFGVDIMDRNVPGIVIPNNALPGLRPQVLDYFPLPPP